MSLAQAKDAGKYSKTTRDERVVLLYLGLGARLTAPAAVPRERLALQATV